MSTIILKGEIVHYEVLGRGRPLIFLHGWVGSWRYWIPAMQAVSTSFRTFAIDFWGFGDSAKIPYLYPLDQQIQLLSQFLDEMGVSKIALIGHGLGAIIAVLYASQNRNQVDRVMAISLPNGRLPQNSRLFNSQPTELSEWLLGHTDTSKLARSEAPKADHQAIQLTLSSLKKLDIDAVKQNLKTPTLLVQGAEDPIMEAYSPQEDYVNLPDNIHQITFEGSGHFPMLDEPSKFNRLIIDFLSLSSGISPRQLQLKEEWKRRVR